MKSQRKSLTDYKHPNAARNPDVLQSKMGYVEEELRRGYRQEALTLSAAMENLTRIYLTRYQMLEKEFTSAKREMEEAEKQKWEAQKTQSKLLSQNRQLVKTLQWLRLSMERHEECRARRRRSSPEITHWKLVELPHRRHLY